ncbi:MAG: DNA-3-methyladenine glycosylase I [Pseudomonadota bacterium]
MIKFAQGLVEGPDGQPRCWWHGGQPDYMAYHDSEWGRPTADDNALFEKICLEGFQSGLSWLTILRKRDNFRAAFANFEISQVAQFGETEVQACLADAGIVRHQGKIRSTINNAVRAQNVQKEFGSLAAYIWAFEPPAEERPHRVTFETVGKLAQTDASQRLSKDLKKRGWSFVGPTTMYAFMQSVGLVNDHLEGCICREVCEDARDAFVRPKPTNGRTPI